MLSKKAAGAHRRPGRRDQQRNEPALVKALHQVAHARSAFEACGSGCLGPGPKSRHGQQGSGASDHIRSLVAFAIRCISWCSGSGQRTQGVFLELGHGCTSSLLTAYPSLAPKTTYLLRDPLVVCSVRFWDRGAAV